MLVQKQQQVHDCSTSCMHTCQVSSRLSAAEHASQWHGRSMPQQYYRGCAD